MFNTKTQWVFLVVVTAAIVTFVYLFSDVFSFSQLKANASELMRYTEQNRLESMFIFILVYYTACVIPFPFVSVLTMLAGFLFGILPALLITSFVSTLGTSTLFLATRHMFSDWANERLVKRFPKLQYGAKSNDFWAAFSLRLVPGMPFAVPSMALALTKLSLVKFYGSTQLGLFLTIFVFVNAGNSLSSINSVSDVFSAKLIFSMLLIGILPLLVKTISSKLKFNQFSSSKNEPN